MIKLKDLIEGENTQRVRDDYKDDREQAKQDYESDLEDAEKTDLDAKQEKRRSESINEEAFSSKEAKMIMDKSLKEYAKLLRKAQYKIIKDWMSKAKSGTLDFFDIQRGLSGGDMSRAHQYETQFLKSVLIKDKIIDRFRSYFGGRKRKR